MSSLASPSAKPRAAWGKPLFDRTVAVLLLIPGLPLIGLLVAIVKLSSKGPGIYSQVRTGLNGRDFTLYKLRSMRVDAELGTGAVWSTGGTDTRVTRLGRILRKTHLDELPQLINVLRGEMSLVGPRPERPEIIETLVEDIPDYPERLQVLPGITGLAQINLLPDTDLDSVRLKLILDREYIDTRTVGLDTRILACTVLRLVGLPTEQLRNLLRLTRHPELPMLPENDGLDEVNESPAKKTNERALTESWM